MPDRILTYIHEYPGLGSLFGSIIGALISASVILVVAHHYTKSLKRTDATLEFSKRFQDLIQQRHELNQKFKTAQGSTPLSLSVGDADAIVWWTHFFDLMAFEFHFFREGLVSEERFVEWMKWQRYYFQVEEPNVSETCGMNYQEGWKRWKARPPMRDNPFIDFLDKIHNQKTVRLSELLLSGRRTGFGFD
jgi:hypothetical protein